ncbi:hypothetical protein QTH87_23775 [Variovorax sp. J22P168]|uniref:hypothetical protein n=1 Tax=Variovorax jilinensis TaxID=3053513 RepID=UPI0025754455|nr:hypothetical protein [Variovorax sp. J22P168]MDM0015483.1 hypothetical protein [Variovorax sp. J22P168]
MPTDMAAARTRVFGSAIDLIRLRLGTGAPEVCEACSTLNMGSARFCKCCSHKLNGFYLARGLGAVQASQWDELAAPLRASALDFAAFLVVIHSLVFITAFYRA